MLEGQRKQAVEEAKDSLDKICDDFNSEFGEKIGNIDADAPTDRIFLLEEMFAKAQGEISTTMLKYAQQLIEAIDEKELIERKKGNSQQKE